MAISSGMCLNFSSLCAPSNSKPKPQLIPPPQREDKWRKQCMVGMACTVIIAGGGGGGRLSDESSSSAVAKDMTSPVVVEMAAVVSDNTKVPRWSDKRKCPPWHLNSLETIVPENLPRPSAKRRWEAVGSFISTKNAPEVKVMTVKTRSNDCFSL